jgi:acyl-CoA thioesterase-1
LATIIMRRAILSCAVLCVSILPLALACGIQEDPPRADAEGKPPDGLSPKAAPAEDARPAVLFLGNSLTAGLGVNEEQAFPALVQERIDEAGLHFRVVNAGVSGETSADGLRRIDWLLQQPVRVLVLELGANDALRGQDVDAMQRNLREIIERTRAKYPDVEIVLAGMEAPPNLGARYTTRFREAFRELAREKGAHLVPFLLQGVAGLTELNQGDRIHPNVQGHRILADNVWRVLEPVLRRIDGAPGLARPAA